MAGKKAGWLCLPAALLAASVVAAHSFDFSDCGAAPAWFRADAAGSCPPASGACGLCTNETETSGKASGDALFVAATALGFDPAAYAAVTMTRTEAAAAAFYRRGAAAACVDGTLVVCEEAINASTQEELVAACTSGGRGVLLGDNPCAGTHATCSAAAAAGSADGCARSCAGRRCNESDACGPCTGECDTGQYCTKSGSGFACVTRTAPAARLRVQLGACGWERTLPAYFENALTSDVALALGLPTATIALESALAIPTAENRWYAQATLIVSYDLIEDPSDFDLEATVADALKDAEGYLYRGAVTSYLTFLTVQPLEVSYSVGNSSSSVDNSDFNKDLLFFLLLLILLIIPFAVTVGSVALLV
eukprot:TRINITY_DN4950_c0_g1_i2.p1 TRINITY_DN4950_c0_g1~~TRINITY_DN4950_c0_g1_i2.p1  ORF type:complete len:365 (+),score=82.21 TRINITY_DN4950_c0_g1_i2:22-1116(+)